MATAAENRQIVEDAYRAMAEGNIKAFVAVLDPEIVVSEPERLPYGGTFTGVKEVLGMFGQAGPVLDAGRLVVEHSVADEDRVAVLLRIPLRSGAGDALIAEHWQMRDGKAVRLDVFWADPTIVAAAAAA
jgi:ketosteroid isomerase-like protein